MLIGIKTKYYSNLAGKTSNAYISGDYIDTQSLKVQIIAGAVFVNGVFTLKRAVPTGTNTVIGHIPTTDVPLQTTYFSLCVPDGRSYLASFSTEGDVVIYNYTGSELFVGWQLYPVGLAWVFK